MFLVVTFWGLDYSVAKNALELFKPLNLMFFKYTGGLVMITAIKLAVDRKFTIRKKDIPFFILCSLTGQVLYYFCEYTAMDYIPVSAMFNNFLPVTSTFFGWLLLGQNISPLQIAGGIIVVIASCVVITEKGKLEKDYIENISG